MKVTDPSAASRSRTSQSIHGRPDTLIEGAAKITDVCLQHFAGDEAAGEQNEVVDLRDIGKGYGNSLRFGHIRSTPAGESVLGSNSFGPYGVETNNNNLGAGCFWPAARQQGRSRMCRQR